MTRIFYGCGRRKTITKRGMGQTRNDCIYVPIDGHSTAVSGGGVSMMLLLVLRDSCCRGGVAICIGGAFAVVVSVVMMGL